MNVHLHVYLSTNIRIYNNSYTLISNVYTIHIWLYYVTWIEIYRIKYMIGLL
jgi:hypothetical protein